MSNNEHHSFLVEQGVRPDSERACAMGCCCLSFSPPGLSGFSCWNWPAVVSRNQANHCRGKDVSHSLGKAHKLKGQQRPGSKENTGGSQIYKMIGRHGSKWELKHKLMKHQPNPSSI